MAQLWFSLLALLLACSIGLSVPTGHGMDRTRLSPAQRLEQPTTPRIGFLALARTGPDPGFEGLRQGLAELSYKDGETIALEPRFAMTTDEYPRSSAS